MPEWKNLSQEMYVKYLCGNVCFVRCQNIFMFACEIFGDEIGDNISQICQQCFGTAVAGQLCD